MNRRQNFAGFDELIRKPLAHTDPRSYERIVKSLEKAPQPHAAPFALLLTRLTGRRFAPDEARIHWERILGLKGTMEDKLGWVVDIQTAAVEYFSLSERADARPAATAGAGSHGNRRALVLARHASPDSPDYHVQRLKDEVQRSKRYNHALSAVMIDIGCEGGRQCDEQLGAVAAIIERTIRTVDVLVACAPARLLVILPETNRREAQELAERLVAIITQRTAKLAVFATPLAPLSSVCQWSTDLTVSAYLKQLESALQLPTADCGQE